MATPPLPDAGEDRSYRPRWLLLTPFLGRAPALTRRQWRVLGLVAVASLFDQYDRSIMALAIHQIQPDLGISDGEVGFLAGIVRLGAVPAFVFALAADRLGRRRILLVTIVAYTVLTGLTAFAPDARTFIGLQFVARIFITAEVLLAVVVLSEELDPEVRGWGIGALFAISACGVGLAALLLPVVGLVDWGWRVLYLFGIIPLLLIASWRRTLPETERFEAHRASRGEETGGVVSLRPMLALIRAYPGRFTALASVTFFIAAGGSAADFFGAKYLQDAHGWAPGHVSLLYIVGGVFAIGGAVLAGWLSDRFGRRPMAVFFGVGVILMALAFYNGSGPWLAPSWMLLIVFVLGNDMILSTYGGELFPTSYRSTAAGARVVVATLAAFLGLSLESVLFGITGSHWTAISVLLLLALLAPLIVALTFPETAGRTLEEISPERELEPAPALAHTVAPPRPEETP